MAMRIKPELVPERAAACYTGTVTATNAPRMPQSGNGVVARPLRSPRRQLPVAGSADSRHDVVMPDAKNEPRTTLSFHRKEWLTIAGGAVNDDGGGSAAQLAWVLDGATGLPQERLLPGGSDAEWLVSEACSFFERPVDCRPAAQHLGALSA